jgi:3-oxoacyl-[acyl-carrier protein] reductase
MTSSKSLLHKTAIVTGGSRGIGAGIALELARRGANILITYNSASQKAEEIASQIRALGSEAAIVQASGTDPESPARVVQAAVEKWTYIDIVVNNAGEGADCEFDKLNYNLWDLQMNCNVRFPVFLVQQAMAHFGQAPRIVNLSSVFARSGPVDCTAYAASKGALESATRALARELGHKFNATINCVNPGPVATDMWLRDTTPAQLAFWEPIIKETPAAPRVAEVDDVAQIVAFLCEEQSRWSTGSVVCANGGMMFV